MTNDDRDPQATANRLAQFEDRLPKKVFQPGAIIFRTGEMDDTAFIVRSGDVQVFTRNEGGQPVLLTTLGPGQILGELALLNERTRSATARTETGCELLVIKPQQINAMLEKAPPFLRFWIEHLANRVIDLTKRVG
jgi:CRP/FNR family cyclic AMP-dependent transcriptional regulator